MELTSRPMVVMIGVLAGLLAVHTSTRADG